VRRARTRSRRVVWRWRRTCRRWRTFSPSSRACRVPRWRVLAWRGIMNTHKRTISYNPQIQWQQEVALWEDKKRIALWEDRKRSALWATNGVWKMDIFPQSGQTALILIQRLSEYREMNEIMRIPLWEFILRILITLGEWSWIKSRCNEMSKVILSSLI